MAPELEQIVGAAQQLPLGLAGGQPAAQEPSRPTDVLNLPKTGSIVCRRSAYRALPSALASLAVIAARSPSLRDADGLPSLRGLPWRPCLAGGINNCGASRVSVRLAIDQ
jgi:hypothetical protein